VSDKIFEYITANPTVFTVSLIISILLLVFIFAKRKDIKESWDYMYNRRKSKEEEHNLLVQTANGLNELQVKHEESVKQSIKHDDEIRKDLSTFMIEIQKEFSDSQKEISNSISALSDKIDEMQRSTEMRFQENENKTNERVRAELKDKISQSYRYYHEKQKINDMEFEALEDLIKSYEKAKGENSFVHSVVQKEMYTWEKVQKDTM
jgi:hypothetical protein